MPKKQKEPSTNIIQRISRKLYVELEEIKRMRRETGKDKNRIMSVEKITDLIAKHNSFKRIKAEIVELDLQNIGGYK